MTGAETRDDHPKRVYMVEKRNATNRLRLELFEIVAGVYGVLILIRAVLFGELTTNVHQAYS
jgi:hypothetical protein